MSNCARILLPLAVCFACLLSSCTVELPPPIVINIVVTATSVPTIEPTQTPYVIIREVTVVVTATPMPSGDRTAEPAQQAATPTPSATPKPPGVRSTSVIAQPPSYVAEYLLSQDIHSVQISSLMEVPLEIWVKDGDRVDTSLTSMVNAALPTYDTGGDFIIDINLDALAQGQWVLKAIGSVNALGDVQTVEVVQIHDRVWRRHGSGAWEQSTLSPAEAAFPLTGVSIPLGDSEQGIALGELVARMLSQIGEDYSALSQADALSSSGWDYLGSRTEDSVVLHGIRRQTEQNRISALASILAFLESTELGNEIPSGTLEELLQHVQVTETIWFEAKTGRIVSSEHQILARTDVSTVLLGKPRTLETRIGVIATGEYQYFPATFLIQPPK